MLKVNTAKIINQSKELDVLDGAFVYFLLKDSVIVYVGQSRSLNARISNHKKSKDFDAVKYLKVQLAHQNELELALIKSIRPAYNTQPLGPMTEGEIRILRSYEFEEQTISQILRSQDSPERGAYGYVGYFDNDGNPHVGYYDDEYEIDSHDEDCKMGMALEILGSDVDDSLKDCLYEYCECEPDAIVMNGFLTYTILPRDELYTVDAVEFQPFREKFDNNFVCGFNKEGNSDVEKDTGLLHY